jgi:hypothetical protein
MHKNMDNIINFENLNFNFTTIIVGIYLIVLGVIYYLIFHKHHKRNKVELFELVSLVTKFYTLTILSTIIIGFGIYCIINANIYIETRSQVVESLLLGIIIISVTIINYIFYIKRNLQDFNQEVREQNKKTIMKIGEILECICFIICILAPILRLPVFIEVFDNRKKLIFEIIKSFAICIAGIILLFALNPLDIKRFFNKKSIDTNSKK